MSKEGFDNRMSSSVCLDLDGRVDYHRRSVGDLAKAAGIAPETARKAIQKRPVSPETANKIANLLNVDVDQIITEDAGVDSSKSNLGEIRSLMEDINQQMSKIQIHLEREGIVLAEEKRSWWQKILKG